MITLKERAAKADGKTICLGCPLKATCNALSEPWTISYRIAKLCSQRFIDGYITGYKAAHNDKKK